MDKDRYKTLMSEATKDERFSHVLQNPLYRRVPKKEKRVEIDKRFKSMFHDKKFKLKYHMDTRGRPIETTSSENLKRLYNLASDEEEDEEEEPEVPKETKKTSKKKDADSSSSGDDEEEEQDEEAGVPDHFDKPDMGSKSKSLSKAERKKLHDTEVDYTRGEGNFISDESSDSSDTEAEEEEEENMHEWGEMDKDADTTEESTTRLALCNMDWDRVSASDLMVLFHSFLPPGGVLKSIAIYTSEFGKQRLAEEELHGPKELTEEKLDSDDEVEEPAVGEEDEEGSGYDMEKLRKYQLKRLKYYYGVLEFNSLEAADKVYNECNGLEYESSATRIDLRYVPDGTTFDDEPKEKCDSLPEKYRPRFFTTTALQQMKVDLTWDETDPKRKELTQRMFDSNDKVDDEDIRAYLASSSESEDDEALGNGDDSEEEKKDPVLKYKALLQSIEDTEKKKKDKDVEMEITWGVGLKQKSEELVKKKLEEKSKAEMTPWEEMLAKRRDKRKARKSERKHEATKGEDDDESSGDDDDLKDSAHAESSDDSGDGTDSENEGDDQPFSDDDVDIDMNDPFFRDEMQSNPVFKSQKKNKLETKGKKEQKGKGAATDPGKDAGELELLLMDEQNDHKRHFSLKKIMEAEDATTSKKKKKKFKKGKKEKLKAAAAADDFNIDLEDNRFSALFSSHHFNVDPSDPNFKKTKAMDVLVGEKQKRRLGQKSEPIKTSSAEPTKSATLPTSSLDKEEREDKDVVDVPPAKKPKSDLAFLVKSIKGKAENLKNRKKNFVTNRPK